MEEMRLVEYKEAIARRKPLRQEPEIDEDGIEIVQQDVKMENHGTKHDVSITIRITSYTLRTILFYSIATGTNGQIPKSKSTATLSNAGHAVADATGGALDKDLSRSLQSLQQRVVSLERSLAPFATPVQVPSSVVVSAGAGPFTTPGSSISHQNISIFKD